MTDTTVAIVLFRSKTLRNGQHPLMIRITQNGRHKYKSMKISCRPQDWNFKKQLPKPSHPNRRELQIIISETLKKYEDRLIALRSKGIQATASELLKMVEDGGSSMTVLAYADFYANKLKERGKFNNARYYRNCYLKLRDYLGESDIMFSDIDYEWLCDYESWLRDQDLRDTTLSAYFRHLKSLYNKAIDQGVASKSNYPFNKFKLNRFDTKTRKRAITREEIARIEELRILGDNWLRLVRDLFIFSFYGGGMNFKDLVYLQWKDLANGRILYKRSKTSRGIRFGLNEVTEQIIEYYRPITQEGEDSYIFPIIKPEKHKTEKDKFSRYIVAIRECNYALKRIGELAGIKTPLTTYVSRHSQATELQNNNVPIGVISQIMGHSSVNTTKIYLQDFGDEVIDDAMKVLLSRKSSTAFLG